MSAVWIIISATLNQSTAAMTWSIICLLVVLAETKATSDGDLISVAMIFRHGDRTPTTFAPLDPYRDPKYWPSATGELTNIGIRQHYNLGKWLRVRYADFLPSKYAKEDVYVRSSSYDRCLMSAASNLAGLYPPSGEQVWNPDLHWRPVPIHSVPIHEDYIAQMGALCTRYQQMYKDLLQSQEFKEIDSMNSKLYSFLEMNLGVKIESFADIQPYYDTLKIEEMYNFTLPGWTKTVYPSEMKKWTELTFRISSYTPELARFGTGSFFDTISAHFQAALGDSAKNLLARKMVMFFGHQENICDITNTLGVYRHAPYASALIFELRNDTKLGKPFVKLFYKTEEELEVLNMKNRSVECGFEDFLKIVEPLRMNETQVEEECKATTKP